MELIRLKKITAKISDTFTLHIPNWSLKKGENWFICGANASGKSLFAKFLLNQVSCNENKNYHFSRTINESIAYVSPDIEMDILNEEIRNDDSEFIEGGFDPGRNALEIIRTRNKGIQINAHRLHALLNIFNIQNVIKKGVRFLSSGETRKVLIVSALIKEPELIILDDPYAGLDFKSKINLNMSLEKLMDQGTQLILIAPIRSERPRGISHLMYLKNGTALIQGNINTIIKSDAWRSIIKNKTNLPEKLPEKFKPSSPGNIENLIEMHNVSVDYYSQKVFENLNWTLRKKEHWSVVGPNGSGKSTLLSMISGDNPKAYGKDIWIFGKKKGSGESIWDIKKHIGFISSDFHRNYRINACLLDVIISGFFDTIGVYDPVPPELERIAAEWLRLIGMEGLDNTAFKELSYGRQRMVLLARAMVKLPTILILDEPCEGLDDTNRQHILQLIDYFAKNGNTQILHVTHDKNEKLDCITHRLTFVRKENSAFKGVCERLS